MPFPKEEPISGSRFAPNISMITSKMISSAGIPRGPTFMSVTILLRDFYRPLDINDNKDACSGTIGMGVDLTYLIAVAVTRPREDLPQFFSFD